MKKIFLIVCLFFVTPAFAEIDAKSTFGIVADCSDETAKITLALAAAQNDVVYFGAGCFGASNLPTFEHAPIIRTAGIAKTTFKNLSPTVRMFEFAKHTAGDLKTSFMEFGGFKLDQNGSQGDGIKIGAMYTSLKDIWILNQGANGWAVNGIGTTLASLDGIHVSSSANGIKFSNSYYVTMNRVDIERTSGVGMKLEYCAEINVKSLYLDNGSVAGPVAAELLQVLNSYSVHFSGLSTEIGNGATLTPNQYFLISNSANVNVFGGRISHYADSGSHYLFYSTNSELNLKGVEWTETKPAMVFAGAAVNNKMLTLRDIVTIINTTGSKYIYGRESTAPPVVADTITHLGQVPSSY